eukprot:CAMPEP_0206201792 /NCGR_PEP_ID=MMETSP0166-20121206/11770_1 /ASSEMBLY_ACC=CAM_ASM_000260 /TAXON_ID=95228 /ORGANISM="Vannella robusta, Strain DIVA3 518/3/11/1/6" /LENGTH=819 /DNA_ID=CAMNT_0053620557 /DNA_START=22 /DNA_END=2481 /DNA_ORIENTATION=-
MEANRKEKLVLWFSELGIEDVPLVGGKSASLGEMYQHLSSKGVKIPNGFAITARAYHYLLEANNAKQPIKDLLDGLDSSDVLDLTVRGSKVRNLIKSLEFPEDLVKEIIEAYHTLSQQYSEENTDTAVRSSATAEDLPDASFAGQQETYLNVHGVPSLLESCKKCFASLFTDRAISYREQKGFDHFTIGLSICVQKMVRSDRACSGVMFSLDTESGFQDMVFITAAYGLGENVVQGTVNPDEYYVFKPTLKQNDTEGTNFRPIVSTLVGSKDKRMIYDIGGNKLTKNIPVPLELQRMLCLTDDEVLLLAKWACIVEDHYSQKAGTLKPMDMEWAKDGNSNELFLVQARPETVHSQTNASILKNYVLGDTSSSKVLVRGHSVGQRIGSGKICIVNDVKQIADFIPGTVLVTEMTDPDWAPVMSKAAAIITNSGGRTCHAAIVSRELGIPCVVGTGNGTDLLQDVDTVTVDCSAGSEGLVWKGEIPFSIEETNLTSIPEVKTRLMMIVGNPDNAFEFCRIPNQGIGLARMEFIVNSSIHIHPLALVDYPNGAAKDRTVKRLIDERTYRYSNKSDFFVDQLAEGIGKIAAAFYPKPVVVRMSDFKTNEYANLIGGTTYEPVEDNPMLGWRGASRYYHPDYERGFALECAAIRKVRDVFGLSNVVVMIPFCRTVEEGKKVLETMAKYGLSKGVNGLKVYAMCEIPSNVLLADEFLSDDLFDGFSIGSNDLTQLTLGLDRDAGSLAHIGNELNPAVKKLFEMVINVANAKGKYIGICGQGPSDFPELAEWLVEKGIHSIALNPDSVLKTLLVVAKKEQSMASQS